MVLNTTGDCQMIFFGFIVLVGFILFQNPSDEKERYDPKSFFPWNEANLVHKRIPNSTTVDCKWKGPEFTFERKEPVFYP